MCFTSRAPSYTRANAAVCVRVCTSMCQNKGATCLYLLLSAFNLSSRKKGRWNEREALSEGKKNSDCHSVKGGWGTNLSPIFQSSHYSFCFPRFLCFFLFFPCLRQKGSKQVEVFFFGLRLYVGVYV